MPRRATTPSLVIEADVERELGRLAGAVEAMMRQQDVLADAVEAVRNDARADRAQGESRIMTFMREQSVDLKRHTEMVAERLVAIESRLNRQDGASATSTAWRAAILSIFGLSTGAIGAVVGQLIGAH